MRGSAVGGKKPLRAQLSFETAMFLSKERIYEQYLYAITSTEYCGPDARGRGSPQQSRIEHIIYLPLS
jgi:hypothetical protein